MIGKTRKINVTELIQSLNDSGQRDCARKLQEKARKADTLWDEESKWLIEAGELIQTLNKCGQRDRARKLKQELEESEKEASRREQLTAKVQRITEAAAKGDLDHARAEYEEVREFLKSGGGEQAERRVLRTPGFVPLLNAYIRAGNTTEPFKLFREESRDLAARSQNPGLQETALAFSDIDDFRKLVEAGHTFIEGEEDKDRRLQMRRWFLEYIAVSCYASILFDCFRRLKERKSTLRYRDDDLARRMSSAAKNAAATAMLEPQEAFERFQSAFKELAESYEDGELQKAALAYSEVNDVWKRHKEARQLAERYENTQLQQQFLTLIAGCCGESILFYSETGQSDEARSAYEDLKRLAAVHGEKQPGLSAEQAKGAGNLVYAYVTAQKPDEARAVYEELRTLAENHPEDRKLTIWQAKGAFDLTYGYAKAGRRDAAKELFRRLEDLAKDKDVREDMQRRKIDDVPMIEWLRQLLQKHSDS